MVKNIKKILAVIFTAVLLFGVVPFGIQSPFVISTSAANVTYQIDKFDFRNLKASPETGNCVYNKIVITPYSSKMYDGKIEDGTWTFSLNDGNYINELQIVTSSSFVNTPSGEGISLDKTKKIITYSGVAKKEITIEHLGTDSVYSVSVVGSPAKHIHTDEDGNTQVFTEFNPATCLKDGFYLIPGYYYLSKNTAIEKGISVKKNETAVICLNGYVLEVPEDGNIGLHSHGNLIITDCNNRKRAHYFNVDENSKWTYYSDKLKTDNVIYGGVIIGTDENVAAVMCYDNSTTTVENISFVGNNCHVIEGGAAKLLEVKNCVFAHNRNGYKAGAIIFEDYSFACNQGIKSKLVVTDCVFEDNDCGDLAGAVYSDCPAAFTRCKFINNQTKSESTNRDPSGGTLYLKNETTITDCEFTGNKAGNNGGAILIDGGTLSVTGGSFAENSAKNGGAICISTYQDGSVTLTDVEFSKNTVSNRGGAICSINYGTKIEATNCTFTGNSSGERGGAVNFDNSGSLISDSCVFTDNTATSWGGAICSNTSDLTLKNTKITGNSSTSQPAGGVAIGEAYIYLYGATVIKDNICTKSGDTYNVRLQSNFKGIEVKEQSKDMCVGITVENTSDITSSVSNAYRIGKTSLGYSGYTPLFSDNGKYQILNETFSDGNYRLYIILPAVTASIFGPVGIITAAALLVFITTIIGIIIYKKKRKKHLSAVTEI